MSIAGKEVKCQESMSEEAIKRCQGSTTAVQEVE